MDHKPHHHIIPFIAVQMALSHFLVIVLRILANKYFLLFSPLTIQMEESKVEVSTAIGSTVTKVQALSLSYVSVCDLFMLNVYKIS